MVKPNQHKGNWQVVRIIQLPSIDNRSDIQLIERCLMKLDGIEQVTGDTHKKHIKVTYDASQIAYNAIVNTLIAVGKPPKNNWWTRLKGGWFQYTDTNARDNAHAPAAPCCNKPPR